MSDGPDETAAMWIVQPDDVVYGVPTVAVIHLDMILCATHLLHVFSKDLVLKQLKHEHT